MTYKEYLIQEKYMKDPRCKEYESYQDWLSDQDIDDVVNWVEEFIKFIMSNAI